jgi:hypothetical protein
MFTYCLITSSCFPLLPHAHLSLANQIKIRKQRIRANIRARNRRREVLDRRLSLRALALIYSFRQFHPNTLRKSSTRHNELLLTLLLITLIHRQPPILPLLKHRLVPTNLSAIFILVVAVVIVAVLIIVVSSILISPIVVVIILPIIIPISSILITIPIPTFVPVGIRLVSSTTIGTLRTRSIATSIPIPIGSILTRLELVIATPLRRAVEIRKRTPIHAERPFGVA